MTTTRKECGTFGSQHCKKKLNTMNQQTQLNRMHSLLTSEFLHEEAQGYWPLTRLQDGMWHPPLHAMAMTSPWTQWERTRLQDRMWHPPLNTHAHCVPKVSHSVSISTNTCWYTVERDTNAKDAHMRPKAHITSQSIKRNVWMESHFSVHTRAAQKLSNITLELTGIWKVTMGCNSILLWQTFCFLDSCKFLMQKPCKLMFFHTLW